MATRDYPPAYTCHAIRNHTRVLYSVSAREGVFSEFECPVALLGLLHYSSVESDDVANTLGLHSPPRLPHEETGLHTLDEDPVRVVSETLQPGHVFLLRLDHYLQPEPQRCHPS